MDQQEHSDAPRGLTVPEVARRYRVSEDKVRGWIRRGEQKAINTATVLCGRPRWVILPDALIQFERRRAATPERKPTQRQPRRPYEVDFFPDGNCDLCGAKAKQERNGKKLCKQHARNAGWRV